MTDGKNQSARLTPQHTPAIRRYGCSRSRSRRSGRCGGRCDGSSSSGRQCRWLRRCQGVGQRRLVLLFKRLLPRLDHVFFVQLREEVKNRGRRAQLKLNLRSRPGRQPRRQCRAQFANISLPRRQCASWDPRQESWLAARGVHLRDEQCRRQSSSPVCVRAGTKEMDVCVCVKQSRV